MGRVGSALDNAAAEAFNSTIKVEYIHRHHFRTGAEARLKIATWIVDFYNTRRRHGACQGMSLNQLRAIHGVAVSRGSAGCGVLNQNGGEHMAAARGAEAA